MRGVGVPRLRRLAALLDSAFQIPGTNVRFGLDPLIGLVPGIGDLASPIFALLVLWQAVALRVPKIVMARMVVNAAVDALVGSIPVAGDAFDFIWKANDWNLDLLERHSVPGQPARRGDYLFLIVVAFMLIVLALIPVVLVVLLAGSAFALGAHLARVL
jgi:hypothetical protein